MSFSLYKKKSSLSFVFNVRDDSISVAVARFHKDKKPEMILCHNFALRIKDSKDHQKYINSLIEAIDKAQVLMIKGLIKMGIKEKISKTYFFLGSPWIVSESKMIKISKDKHFTVDKNLLSRIITNEEESFKKSLTGTNWKVLEQKIIQSRLNGYNVEKILGKKTLDLAVELFVSYIPKELKDKLMLYGNKKISEQNNSCVLSAYTFFRDLYSNKNDFIYVDIGKMITDIYVVRDDVIFGTASFAYGEENILQDSLARTNLSREVFLSYINIGQDKNFQLVSHNNGEDLLKHGFDIWKKKFREILPKICNEVNVPTNMFIIKNNAIPSILVREMAGRRSITRFEILGTKIKVSSIGERTINDFVTNGRDFVNEPYIKMDLVFIDKMLKNK